MTSSSGFGKPQSQPKVSKRANERKAAAQRYDQMKTEGTPEFEVYIRIQGKKNWYPVGAIAVKRSSLIDRAIFDSQEQLLQGAFRLFPILRKNQNQLEYGYRLKEYKDEPIKLAVKPKAVSNPLQSAISQTVSQLSDRLTGLLQRNQR